MNRDLHQYIENEDHPNNQPPYLEQALILTVLVKGDIINLKGAFDFGAGYGTLKRILNRYFDLDLLMYDPFVWDGKNQSHVST